MGAALWLLVIGIQLQPGTLANPGEVGSGTGRSTGDPGDEQDRSKEMNGSDDKVESLDRTVLRVGDTDVTLTLDDVKAIRAALLDYLRQSDYEDRDALIGWTQGPAWIDAERNARVGPWLLGSEGKDIILRYREPPGQHAGKAHKATLTRDASKWTVGSLVMERIRTRR